MTSSLAALASTQPLKTAPDDTPPCKAQNELAGKLSAITADTSADSGVERDAGELGAPTEHPHVAAAMFPAPSDATLVPCGERLTRFPLGGSLPESAFADPIPNATSFASAQSIEQACYRTEGGATVGNAAPEEGADPAAKRQARQGDDASAHPAAAASTSSIPLAAGVAASADAVVISSAASKTISPVWKQLIEDAPALMALRYKTPMPTHCSDALASIIDPLFHRMAAEQPSLSAATALVADDLDDFMSVRPNPENKKRAKQQ
jgi:hypothetical protein